MNQKEFQQKLLEYNLLQERIGQLIQQRNFVESKLEELEVTEETIEEVGKIKENDILVAVGSLTYINARLTSNDKVIVEVGAGVALEKTIEEAKQTLEKRKKNLQDALKKLDEEIQKVGQLLQVYQMEIQKLQKKSTASTKTESSSHTSG